MNKEWKQSNWFNKPDQEPLKCFIRVGNQRVLDGGVVRFNLTIYTEVGDLVLKGFRYDPSKDKVMPPCFRVGGGFQPIVRLDGPIEEAILETAQGLAETEPVGGEVVEARD